MSLRPPPHALNRRAGRRTALRGPATVVLSHAPMDVQLCDLGPDGLCVLTRRPISPGTRCTLSFDLPSDAGPVPLTVRVKVVYSSFSGANGFKVGAIFIDLDQSTVDMLAALTGTD